MHFSKLFTVSRLLSQPPSSAAQLGPIRTQTGRLFQRYTQSSPQQQSAGPRSSPFTGQATTRRNTQIIQLAEADGSGHVGPTRLWKPVLFTATFSVGTFVAVSIWEYENLATLRLNRKSVEWFRQRVQSQQRHLNERYRVVQNWWASLTPGERVFVPLCVLNLAVFGAWRVPALKGFMMAYFCSNPAAKAVCWPMVLSTFSHYSGFHIFANMYVLHSFANAATLSLGTEQFLGVYLGAGVVSSLASYALKASTGMAGMSLGASGAIMGILAYVCSKYPDTELGILFLPMVTFSAGSAIKVLMGVDLAGCLLGWKFFDHAAHLGGALVGIFWCYFGAQHIWPKRIYVQQYWHQLRAK